MKRLALTLLLLSALLVNMAAPALAAGDAKADRLNIAIASQEGALNPYGYSSETGYNLTHLIYDSLFILAAEYENPATLGPMPLGEKVLNALFQSATVRTAGFDALGQAGLHDPAKAMSLLLMLIGGSSGSTAGGIKTATVGVLLLALRAGLTGREQVTLRGRAIPYDRVLSAMTLALVVLFLFLGASVLISAVEGLSYLDCAFEVASAMATVGLTAGVTTLLSPFSQALLIVLIPLIILILLIQLAFGGQFIRIKRFGPGRRTTPPPRPSSPRTDVPASEDVIDAVAVDLPDEPVPPEKQIDRASSSE